MIDVLTCILLTALSVNGLSIATDPGMILEPLKIWVKSKLGDKWSKPVISCVKCMPSVYGTIICLLILPCTFALLWQIPLVILSASTLATIINQNYI